MHQPSAGPQRRHWIQALAVAPWLGQAKAQGQPLSPAQLREDLQQLREFVARTHPDPAFSCPPAELAQAYQMLEQGLSEPLSPQQAWLRFARLNPLLADAHWFVGLPDWRKRLRSHVASGGRLFPFEVALNAAGELTLLAELGGPPSRWRGARVLRIDGQPVQQRTRALLALMHGDTPEFRARVLERRFAFFHQLLFGDALRLELLLELQGRRQRVQFEAAAALPQLLQEETDFERCYQFELRPDGEALLTLHSFYWPDLTRYLAFTRQAFERMRAAGSRVLTIDLRRNPGGDDVFWKRGLLDHLASRPYRAGAQYLKKVLPGRAGPNETVGQVVPGEIQAWEPAAGTGRFSGAVRVLVGRQTYSSAVLFANTVQDHGFGLLVGEVGQVRTRQSGGIQTEALRHSALEITAPRFILGRPSGQDEPRWLQPDLRLADPPEDPQQLLRSLRRGFA